MSSSLDSYLTLVSQPQHQKKYIFILVTWELPFYSNDCNIKKHHITWLLTFHISSIQNITPLPDTAPEFPASLWNRRIYHLHESKQEMKCRDFHKAHVIIYRPRRKLTDITKDPHFGESLETQIFSLKFLYTVDTSISQIPGREPFSW